jgi:hypothetical protein
MDHTSSTCPSLPHVLHFHMSFTSTCPSLRLSYPPLFFVYGGEHFIDEGHISDIPNEIFDFYIFPHLDQFTLKIMRHVSSYFRSVILVNLPIERLDDPRCKKEARKLKRTISRGTQSMSMYCDGTGNLSLYRWALGIG